MSAPSGASRSSRAAPRVQSLYATKLTALVTTFCPGCTKVLTSSSMSSLDPLPKTSCPGATSRKAATSRRR